MWKSLVACFNGVTEDEAVEVRERKNSKRTFDQRKRSHPKLTNNSKGISMPLSGDRQANPKLLYCREEEDGDDYLKRSCDKQGEKVVRVKLVLTKQEFAQLMSKCKGDGGILGDVLSELKRIETDRVGVVVPPNSSCGPWRPALATISEDR